MRKILFIAMAFIGFSVTINAQSLSGMASSAVSGDLIKDLMAGAQVNKEQAMGGAGALFEMAKENMSAEDFKGVKDAVPNIDKLIDAVPNVGGKTSALSSAATKLTGMPKVQAAFSKLGISSDKVSLFTPIIVNYIKKKGGKLLGDKLGKSFL